MERFLSRQSGVRGLATVALLKTQYDQGHDHIEMFMPFVVDALDGLGAVFTTEAARDEVLSRHGLKIPLETMGTLLNRAKKRDLIRREGGAYHKEAGSHANEIEATAAQIHGEHQFLAQRFLEFAHDEEQTLEGPDEALSLVFSFLAQNEVELLLDQDVDLADLVPSGPSKHRARLAARFLRDVAMKDERLSSLLQRMLEGFVLQNALLLKDISSLSRQFSDLSVFYDSGFLFGLLGLLGGPQEEVCRESVELLQAAGARLGVFPKTLEEMRGILALYERKLATQAGRESLRPTPLTRHLLTSRATPSELRQISALLEQTLRDTGIQPTPSPSRVARFTLDEASLSNSLKRDDETINEPRVVHDVDCIAAVLTLRGGKEPSAIDSARAIFATDSGKVIRTVVEWYRAQGKGGVPPIIYHTTLSNLAWLKRPASGAKLKVHELVALCSAALQPDRTTWDTFLAHLNNLEKSGAITSDEAVAVVVSSFTDKLLGELEDEVRDASDLDAESMTEVVERVRATYRAEQDAIIEQKSKELLAERERRTSAVAAIDGGSRRLAEILAWLVSGVAALAVAGGSLMLLPGAMDRLPDGLKPWAYGLAILAALFAGWALLTGDSVIGVRGRLERALRERIKDWFIPE